MADERLRIVVTGAAGRMGSAIIAAMRGAPDVVLSGATERPGSPDVGHELDAVTVRGSVAEASSNAQVVIDFTSPDATMHHAWFCAERRLPAVIGTTGLSAHQKSTIAGLASHIPVVLAPNMSVGVNVLFRLAADVARAMGDDYDVEIVETHHRLKKDAPSGTALRLAEAVAGALKLDPGRDIVKARDGVIGERPRRTIGVQSVRGGDVVGDHTVFYFGQGERLELTHRATSRDNFAQGALRAARWVVRQPPGLYEMTDVLGFPRSEAT